MSAQQKSMIPVNAEIVDGFSGDDDLMEVAKLLADGLPQAIEVGGTMRTLTIIPSIVRDFVNAEVESQAIEANRQVQTKQVDAVTTIGQIAGRVTAKRIDAAERAEFARLQSHERIMMQRASIDERTTLANVVASHVEGMASINAFTESRLAEIEANREIELARIKANADMRVAEIEGYVDAVRYEADVAFANAESERAGNRRRFDAMMQERIADREMRDKLLAENGIAQRYFQKRMLAGDDSATQMYLALTKLQVEILGSIGA